MLREISIFYFILLRMTSDYIFVLHGLIVDILKNVFFLKFLVLTGADIIFRDFPFSIFIFVKMLTWVENNN